MRASTGRIWEATSSDPSRPVLQGVFFDAKKKTLTASDAYILVRVPCDVEAGDESGIIPAVALKEAAGRSLKVADGKATLTLPDGERTWKLVEGKPIPADMILGDAKSGPTRFGLNPDLLAKVGKTVRSNKVAPLILSPLHPLKPIRVSTNDSGVEALIMPIRIEDHGEIPVSPPDLSNDDKIIEAAKAAVDQIGKRRGKKRAAQKFREVLNGG